VARKRVKYRVLTLFRAKFVAGAPVRKTKYWKCQHHDGDTSRYQEFQFRYRSVRKRLRIQKCMFLGGQRDIKRWTCVWSRVVHICGVLPCLSYELIATPQGACSARKRPAKKWVGIKSIGDTFFQTTMTHSINFFASFPVVKQEHVEGNTECNGVLHLFIGFPSVMVVIAKLWTRWWLRFAHGRGHTEQ